jgi:hypothetical protein
LGRWYDLYSNASGQPSTDPQGSRIYDIGAVTITPTAGGSALVEGTDYEVDHVMGRIFVYATGSMVAGTDYDLDIAANSSATTTVDRVQAMGDSTIEGALKFIAENPADDDVQVEYQFHKVLLSSDGDFSLIGDDWSTMTLKGTAEENTTADPDSPVLTIITYDGAKE